MVAILHDEPTPLSPVAHRGRMHNAFLVVGGSCKPQIHFFTASFPQFLLRWAFASLYSMRLLFPHRFLLKKIIPHLIFPFCTWVLAACDLSCSGDSSAFGGGGLQDPYVPKIGNDPLSGNYSVSEASSLVTKPSVVDYSDLASILIDGFDVCKVCPNLARRGNP